MQINRENYAEYIRELHEFSQTYHVPCGKPEDLKNLVERLETSETFAADFASMIRSVVFRERFQASPSDLLNLVTIAWSGKNGLQREYPLPAEIKQLKTILDSVLKGGAGQPPASANEDDETSDAKPEPAPNAIPEISKSPQSIPPKQREDEAVASAEIQEQPERHARNDSSLMHLALQRSAVEKENRSSPLLFQNSPYATPAETETESTPRRGPGAAEILAFGLAGLVIGLLATIASLPVYRAHVSVLAPAAESQDSLRSGKLTQQVSRNLLLITHPVPILRQDALSRGMRDLGLGGNETILYATLVAETAQQVKVHPLPTPNLYEITCDSWSSQFAATFCNELVNTVEQQPSNLQSGTDSARKIDAESGPGIQIYPQWYLQGVGGFAVGCLLGALFGLIKRS